MNLKTLEKKLELHEQWVEDARKGEQLLLKNKVLVGLHFRRRNLQYACFDKCFLMLSNFYMSNLYFARFPGCHLQGASLKNNKMENADFKNTNLQGANLSGSDIWCARFNHANLENAKFTKLISNFRNEDFLGANLKNTLLPEGVKNWIEFLENKK
jgi:uncharacterized protein YjbI with pentapeptide repeats